MVTLYILSNKIVIGINYSIYENEYFYEIAYICLLV